MSKLLQKLKKASKIKGAESFSNSEFFKLNPVMTNIPLLNVAFNGHFDGGMTGGITMMAGESRTFKTGFLVQLALAFQKKHPDGVVIFYDCEFSPMEYWSAAGIDMDRVLHTPITTIEELKHDMANHLDNHEDGEHVIFLIDSIGGLASKKEAEDAVKSAEQPVDMTRAKVLNSFFRIVTPRLNKFKLDLVLINSFYETMEMYAKRIYGGGKKVFLSCDDVWFISRSQEKEGSDLVGYNFTLNIDKSRVVKEGSKFPIRVTHEGGINRYSGLYELAKECGLVQVGGAWVKLTDLETGEVGGNVRVKAIPNEWYEGLLKHKEFQEFVANKYLLEHSSGEE